MPDAVAKKEPYCRALSDRVKVYYGYADAHAKLVVLAPIGIEVPVNLKIEEILKIKETFDEAHSWAIKPEGERKSGSVKERILDPRGKVSFGFPDGHVVISVRILPNIPPWIPLDITCLELIQGKKAMDEVHQWSLLPSELRELQGV